MPRTIKSSRELADMIIVELRKHPQCKDVLKIRITRPVTKNWDVTVIWSRERECPAPCTKIVEATVQRLRALYDLPGRK
jgi:hypothetical protein